jgi:hypothetical protein
MRVGGGGGAGQDGIRKHKGQLDHREDRVEVAKVGGEREVVCAMVDVVNGVLLPSKALNCLPGCYTRLLSCSRILD